MTCVFNVFGEIVWGISFVQDISILLAWEFRYFASLHRIELFNKRKYVCVFRWILIHHQLYNKKFIGQLYWWCENDGRKLKEYQLPVNMLWNVFQWSCNVRKIRIGDLGDDSINRKKHVK